MNTARKTLIGLGTVGLCATIALGAIIRLTENFENINGGDPQRGWTFNTRDEGIAVRNGNHYFRTTTDNYGVTLSAKTDGSNRLAGNKNYRTEGVVGFEITTAGTADFSNTIRDMSISIVNDNGTPSDWSDDYGFYHVTGQMMNFNGNIRTYRYPMPSQVTGTTPDGWVPWVLGPNSPTEFTWDQVVTDVDQLNFHYFNPDFFYIFQFHNVGVDNIRVIVNTDYR